MVKTERVLQYTKLPAEAELQSNIPPPVTWPTDGSVVFQNVSMAYHTGGPVVLKDVSFKIHPGEKVQHLQCSTINLFNVKCLTSIVYIENAGLSVK